MLGVDVGDTVMKSRSRSVVLVGDTVMKSVVLVGDTLGIDVLILSNRVDVLGIDVLGIDVLGIVGEGVGENVVNSPTLLVVPHTEWISTNIAKSFIIFIIGG